MAVQVRAAQPGDGAALATVWLDNARYYVGLFPDDFRMPDEAGQASGLKSSLLSREAHPRCIWSQPLTMRSARSCTRG
jgi:hypothetical protein